VRYRLPDGLNGGDQGPIEQRFHAKLKWASRFSFGVSFALVRVLAVYVLRVGLRNLRNAPSLSDLLVKVGSGKRDGGHPLPSAIGTEFRTERRINTP